MKKLLDLRFVIGVFFTLIGFLLLAYHFMSAEGTTSAVNLWAGVVFAVFGLLMILLSIRKDARDELLEE